MSRTVVANELVKLAKSLMAGCEKLPEGGMRENCEKKKEEGNKEAGENKVAAELVKLAKSLMAETDKVETTNNPDLNLAVNALVKVSGGDLGKILQAVFMTLRKTGNAAAISKIKPLFQQALNKAGVTD